MVDLLEIGVLQCDKDNNDHSILSHIQPSELEDDEYSVTVSLAEQFVNTLIGKDFSSMNTTSRIHEFPTSASVSSDGGAVENSEEEIGPSYDLLESLRSGESFDDDLDNLGIAYNQVAYSRSGILLAIRHELFDQVFLSIVKAPFETGYEPREDVGVAELGDIIEDTLQKGSVFPYYNERTGEVNSQEVGIYQISYAKHWWRFHGVTDAKTNDEVLAEKVKTEVQDDEPSPLNEISSVRDFPEIKDEYSDAELEGEVDISIDGVNVKVKLRDLLEENVFVVEDDAFYLVISGNRPRIRTKQTSQGQKRILENLEEYHSFDDIQ